MYILYRPSWQKLRLSCTQDYAPHGGLLTSGGAKEILARMKDYLRSIDEEWSVNEIRAMKFTSELEEACRVYRVYNFLTATLNGLAKNKSQEHLQDIRELLKTLKPEVDLHTVHLANDRWNWNVIVPELRQLLITDNAWFHRIYADMKERVVEKRKTADEMRKFIELMREVNDLYKNDTW